MRLVAAAMEKVHELFAGYPREHRGTGDFVAVEVQYRKHGRHRGQDSGICWNASWVPASRFRLRHRPLRNRPTGPDCRRPRRLGVQQRVAQFTAFVDGAGRLRRDMAGNASGKRELRKQALHAFFVARDVGIGYTPWRSFQRRRWATTPGPPPPWSGGT